MTTKYTVIFTGEEREWLEEFTYRGRTKGSTGKAIAAV